MKVCCVLVLAALAAADTNPVAKTIQLLSSLEAKISLEGETAGKEFIEFTAWCEDRTRNLAFDIQTGKSTAAELKAKIDSNVAAINALNIKIDGLGGALATDEADLKSATWIRQKEHEDFAAEDAELTQALDMLGRAIGIIEKEMNGGASMMQLKSAGSIAQALSVMVEATAISSSDSEKLMALVQSSQQSDDEDTAPGAPAAAVYQSQSGGILATLQGIYNKAEEKLATLRQTETTNLHSFQLLKQSILDEIKFGKKDMAESKKALAAHAGEKAGAEGDLAVTTTDLDGDIKTLEETKHDCMTRTQEHEAAVKSRAEELAALAEAKKVLVETTGGADTITYGLNQVSFLQLSNGKDLANFEAVRFVRTLAKKYSSASLSQLASRMASAVDAGDPFGKVRGLISAMVERLEAEADADATHKAFCDKHLAETHEKRENKEAEIAKLSTKIDQMSARSAQLKEEIAALQKALADLHASQSEMDKMRAAEKAEFGHDKAELEEGLQGVKMALKILRDYYAQEDKAHAAAEGAAGGIIGLLEVVESDFTKNLAEIVANEQAAQAAYEQQTKENQIEQANKEADVKYKTKESTGLDKAVAEASSDRSGVQAELAAVMDVLANLNEQCIEKAETYSERTARRAAEIAGLKEALEILEGEAAFLQQASKRQLRGAQI